MSRPKSWFSITPPRSAVADTEVFIYDEIGMWGVSAQDLIAEIRAITGDITVRLNSPGGEVTQGWAIYSALTDHPGKITTIVDGWACSMASVILLAGETRRMGKGSAVMVHSPSFGAYGKAEDLRRAADLTDKFAADLKAAYIERTGSDEATVDVWMAKDTWFFGQEAVDAGLATETFAQERIAACFDPRAVANKVFQTPPPPRALEVFIQPTTEDIRMKELLKALGLKEDASEQSAAEAVKALGERVTTAEANVATARNELKEANKSLADAVTAKNTAETARIEAVTALAETAAKSARVLGKIADTDDAEKDARELIANNPAARAAFDMIPAARTGPTAAAPIAPTAGTENPKGVAGAAAAFKKQRKGGQ